MTRVESSVERHEKKFEPIPCTVTDLKHLVATNPGTGILNPRGFETYFGTQTKKFPTQTYDDKFDFNQCDPIRVLRVKTARGTQLLIQDGHHRAVGALNHIEIVKTYLKEDRIDRHETHKDVLLSALTKNEVD